MSDFPASATPFERAEADIRETSLRDDLVVHEIAAPTGLAPYAIALAGDVRPGDEHGDGTDSPFGTGRFILLHDPDEPDAWDGAWRIVCFAQAPLEPEIGIDPLVADVAWSWLTDALDIRGAQYTAASGTATKTLSKGFGALASAGDGAQIEMRASWTPTAPFAAHVAAWGELVCMLAGLPPGSEGIALLRTKGGQA